MNYSELVRSCSRDLREARKRGFPEWAMAYVEELLLRAAFFRDEAKKVHSLVGPHYARAIGALCEAGSVMRAYRINVRASTSE